MYVEISYFPPFGKMYLKQGERGLCWCINVGEAVKFSPTEAKRKMAEGHRMEEIPED